MAGNGMEIMFPDYDNCIVNLSCSVMKRFGITPPNPSLPLADKLLERKSRNVVLMLLDGMGLNIMEKDLSPDGFFRQNLAGVYSSVFPPTTVAATTSLDSGLYPVQTAWLGWTGYFKGIDRNVEYFSNKDFDTEEPIEFINAARTYVPYREMCSIINDGSNAKAYYLAPFTEPHPESFDGLCREVERICSLPGEKYVYAYWHEPDSVMHRKGCFSENAKSVLREMESRAEELARSLEDKDTIFLITADHGHIDSPKRVVTDYPDIMECLVRMPSIEPRCVNLFVKDSMGDRLERAFSEHFPEDFLLMKKEEVIKRGLFGRGTPHPRFNDMLGDYLAVAVGDISLYNKSSKNFKANHAGLTRAEMEIPLIDAGQHTSDQHNGGAL